MIKSAWEGFWNFFKNSGTILIARVEAFFGFVLAAFSTFDWTSFTSIDVTSDAGWRQAAFLGVAFFIKGIVSEITRRSGTTEVDSKLIPTVIVEKPKTMIKKIEAKVKADEKAKIEAKL